MMYSMIISSLVLRFTCIRIQLILRFWGTLRLWFLTSVGAVFTGTTSYYTFEQVLCPACPWHQRAGAGSDQLSAPSSKQPVIGFQEFCASVDTLLVAWNWEYLHHGNEQRSTVRFPLESWCASSSLPELILSTSLIVAVLPKFSGWYSIQLSTLSLKDYYFLASPTPYSPGILFLFLFYQLGPCCSSHTLCSLPACAWLVKVLGSGI